MSYVFLLSTPFLVFSTAAVRALRIPVVYQALAVVQLVAVSAAAWALGAWAILTEDDRRRTIALAGALLVAPWVLFALLAGIGLPQQATPPENDLRYAVLLLDDISIACGLVVLTDALRQAGERFYSTIGFAVTMLIGPLSVVWAVLPLGLGDVAAQERASSGQVPLWLTSLQGVSALLLMSTIFLTYIAAASFGAALGRTAWLGRTASRAFVRVSLFAVLCLAVMTAVAVRNPHEPMAIFRTWYAIPGFIFSIPAVSFMIPSLLGVIVLKRAGDSTESLAHTSSAA